MIKSKLKSFFFLGFFFFCFQAGFGQVKITNDHILKEIQQINKIFSDSLSHYDFKTDEKLYLEKYGTFYRIKIESLSQRYRDLNAKSLADEVMVHQSGNGEKKAADLQLGLADFENGEQLKELGLFLRNNYPTYLFSDGLSDSYRSKLNFLVDTDGTFKKVKYSGEKLEFNLISALFLYAIGNLEKPLRNNGQPIKQNFALPVSLLIE